MTDSASAASASPSLFAKDRRPYLWRKLFSLTGLMPIAGFTLFHLWENSKALQGRGSYIQMVNDIDSMPFLTALELGVILLPIALHATIGTLMILNGRYNVGSYPFSGNWTYTLQRITAVGAFGFIVYHLYELRLQKLLTGMDAGGFYDTLCRNMSSTTSGVPLVALVYILGIAAVAFHLANGLWGFCFSWGITVSQRSQRMAAWLFGAVGVVVFVIGANTSMYFATGSRLFIPSEWFSPHKPAAEQCVPVDRGALESPTPPSTHPASEAR